MLKWKWEWSSGALACSRTKMSWRRRSVFNIVLEVSQNDMFDLLSNRRVFFNSKKNLESVSSHRDLVIIVSIVIFWQLEQDHWCWRWKCHWILLSLLVSENEKPLPVSVIVRLNRGNIQHFWNPWDSFDFCLKLCLNWLKQKSHDYSWATTSWRPTVMNCRRRTSSGGVTVYKESPQLWLRESSNLRSGRAYPSWKPQDLWLIKGDDLIWEAWP